MNAIIKPIVWIALLPINLLRWIFRALIWLIILPFKIINTIFILPFWFFRWIFSIFHRSYTLPATILRMWHEAYMADSNYYVIFDSRGKHIKIRLNPFQEKSFFSKHSEGDVGKLTYRGAWLVRWQPATAKNPISDSNASRIAFISYVHEWKEDAQFVAKYIKSRGFKVWIDEDQLRVGDSLDKRVINAIEKADYFIPMLSENYCFSEWCIKELETAINGRCRILPIKVEDGELTMPPHISRLFKISLGDVIFVDLRKKNPYSYLNQLISIMSE